MNFFYNFQKQLIVEEPRRRSQIRRYGHDESVVDCSDLETSASESDKEQAAQEEDGEEGMRKGRGRGRGRGRGSGRGRGRMTRSSRWAMEEENMDPDNVKYGCWARSECFKVEKCLLTYGWGRWKDSLANGDFRPAWKEEHIQDCARMILLFCIHYYRGDDKIKGFIFDLIAPTNDGKPRVYHNHIGLSAPVPRGRKGKKKLREAKLIASHMDGAEWAKDEKYDTDAFLDQGYSRHLTRHANKVLLRVRLLFYIRQEIIGDLDKQVSFLSNKMLEICDVNLDKFGIESFFFFNVLTQFFFFCRLKVVANTQKFQSIHHLQSYHHVIGGMVMQIGLSSSEFTSTGTKSTR